MPAAAVTPAPIAYIKVVAVKKLVVGCLSSAGRRRSESRVFCVSRSGSPGVKARLSSRSDNIAGGVVGGSLLYLLPASGDRGLALQLLTVGRS